MLFGKRKSTDRPAGDEPNAQILVLGAGCPKCKSVEAAAKAAIGALGLEEPVGHVWEMQKIAAYGVMSLPALVVDGKVVSVGRVLTKDEIINLLKTARPGL